MRARIERLSEEHRLEAFDCGNSELNAWLHGHAAGAARQGTRTYVLLDHETDDVVGYFALAPFLLERDELPARIGRGAPRRIPAILLAKLAIAASHQSEGLGGELLSRALERMLTAARIAGGKVAVVDAIDDDVVGFHLKYDFVPSPSDPRRLVAKLSSIARTLGQPWP